MPYFATHGFRLSVLRPCQRSQVLNELKLWNKLELDELTAVKGQFQTYSHPDALYWPVT